MHPNSVPLLHLQPRRRIRYLVLGTASLLALAFWLATEIPGAGAQPPGTAPATPAASEAPTPKAAAPTPSAPAAAEAAGAQKSSTPAAPEAAGNAKEDFTAKIDVRKDKDGKRIITIEKKGELPDEAEVAAAAAGDTPAADAGSRRKRDKHVRVDISGADKDFDSFEQFVESQPALAAMVVGIVAVVFLSPVLAIGLILWYRFRKTRMMNEAMLKLAEKGVVPPSQALNALASGTSAAAFDTATAGTPLQEQARQIRRRTAWSDLRRGVILGGIGLALTVYSAWDDGRPNIAGLVLLFLGAGYAILWWFEERQLKPGTGPASGLANGPPTA